MNDGLSIMQLMDRRKGYLSNILNGILVAMRKYLENYWLTLFAGFILLWKREAPGSPLPTPVQTASFLPHFMKFH